MAEHEHEWNGEVRPDLLLITFRCCVCGEVKHGQISTESFAGR